MRPEPDEDDEDDEEEEEDEDEKDVVAEVNECVLKPIEEEDVPEAPKLDEEEGEDKVGSDAEEDTACSPEPNTFSWSCSEVIELVDAVDEGDGKGISLFVP